MATLNTKMGVLLFACTSGLIYGQTKQPSIEQKAEKSVCANIVALTGNVNMNCSNLSSLTPAQKKALADIPEILKMALANQNYLDAILEKMNAMSQRVTVNNAPGGFAVSGGTVINPQVTNLGPPPAQIIVATSEILPPIPPLTASQTDPNWNQKRMAWANSLAAERFSGRFSRTTANPGLRVSFHVSESVPDPAFGVDCDQPCVITGMLYGRSGDSQLSAPALLTGGTTVVMYVRSLDANKPISSVTPIFAKDAPAQ